MFDPVQIQGIAMLTCSTFAFLVFIKAIRSARKHNNLTISYVAMAAISLSLDFFFEGFPLLFFPQSQLLIALGITVLGPFFIHATLGYLLSIVIVTVRPTFSINYRLIVFLLGVFAGALNFAHNGGTVSFHPNGFVNPGFNPIAEFITFFTTIVVVIVFGITFIGSKSKKKMNIRGVLIGVGAIAVGISSPVIYSANDRILSLVLNSLTIVGMFAITLGVYLKSEKEMQQQ